jgi:hypothetical protein
VALLIQSGFWLFDTKIKNAIRIHEMLFGPFYKMPRRCLGLDGGLFLDAFFIPADRMKLPLPRTGVNPLVTRIAPYP